MDADESVGRRTSSRPFFAGFGAVVLVLIALLVALPLSRVLESILTRLLGGEVLFWTYVALRTVWVGVLVSALPNADQNPLPTLRDGVGDWGIVVRGGLVVGVLTAPLALWWSFVPAEFWSYPWYLRIADDVLFVAAILVGSLLRRRMGMVEAMLAWVVSGRPNKRIERTPQG